MASYKIVWKKSAIKELRKFDKAIIKQILTTTEKLTGNPYPIGVRKIKASKFTYRLRSGNYRIIYSVKAKILTIEIIRVSHRKEAYR